MLAIAFAVLASRPNLSAYASLRQSLWASARASLKSTGERLSEFGLELKFPSGDAKTDVLLQRIDGPIPAQVDFTPTISPDGWVKFDFLLHLNGSRVAPGDIGIQGTWATNGLESNSTGQGVVSLLGTKLSTSFEFAGKELTHLVGSYAEGGLSVISRLVGEDHKGPVAFGYELGGFSAEFNPQVFLRMMQEHGKEYADVATKSIGEASAAASRELQSGLLGPNAQGIGGVTTHVSLVDLAYAVRDSATPPPTFAPNRIVVSLRQLARASKAGETTDLGRLTHIDGFVIDEPHHDVLLLGTHYEAAPPILVETVAAAFQAEFTQGMEPYISIDPDWTDFTKPHHPRVGGVPANLRNSNLIATMLHADYAMKQFALGKQKVEGMRSLLDILSEHKNSFAASRFWIAPRPLAPGDVRVGTAEGRRLVTFSTEPQIRTEVALGQVAAGADGKVMPSNAGELEANELTRSYPEIEAHAPDAGFAAVRQILELSTAIALLKREALGECAGALQGVADLPIPATEIPSDFEPVSMSTPQVGGRAIVLVGGVTTSPELTDAAASASLATAASSVVIPSQGWQGDTPPIVEDAETARILAASELGAKNLKAADVALDNDDLQRAESFAVVAARLLPRSAAPRVVLAQISARRSDTLHTESFARDAIELDSKSPDAHYLLALALFTEHVVAGDGADKKELFDDVRAEIDQVQAIAPTSPSAHWLKAKLLNRLGNRDVAIAELDTAIANQPDFTPALLLRAGYRNANGDADGALKDLDALLTIEPGNVDARYLRGTLHLERKQAGEALADFEIARDANPKDVFLRLKVAEALLANDEPAFADEEATKAIEFDNRRGESYEVRARAEEAEGLWGLAVNDLRKTAELDSAGQLDRDDLQRQIDICETHMSVNDQWIIGGEAVIPDASSGAIFTRQDIAVTVHHDFVECVVDTELGAGSNPVDVAIPEAKLRAIGWATKDPTPMFSSFNATVDGHVVEAKIVRTAKPGIQLRSVSAHQGAKVRFFYRTPLAEISMGTAAPRLVEVIAGGVSLSCDVQNWRTRGYASSIKFTLAPDCGDFAVSKSPLRLAPDFSDPQRFWTEFLDLGAIVASGPAVPAATGHAVHFDNSNPSQAPSDATSSFGVFFKRRLVPLPNPIR